MIDRKDRPDQVSHKTTFHGPVQGAVHTGSGDIHVSDLSYGADEQQIAGLRDSLIVRLNAAKYQIVTAVVNQLEGQRLREVQEMTAALERTQLAERETAQLLANLHEVMAEAQEKAILAAPTGTPSVTDVIDAPSLSVAHKLKLTIPIIPFLLDYEGEVELDSGANLEMAWLWLKGKLVR